MSDRPPRDVNWIPDDATGISVPSTTKQNAGWIVEKVPLEFLNWLWNRCSRWFHYLSGQSQEFIVIDSTNTNEKDYDTLAAYIADSPAAGDKVLVKETQALTAQMIIPAGITLRILGGITFTRSTLEANSVIKFDSGVIIEGVLNLVLSHTGTTAKAIEFDGDDVSGKINVENSSTGALTTAYHINASKTGNALKGFVKNTGGGAVTNIGVDLSTEDSNLLQIIDKTSKQIFRSLGSNTFFTGFKFLFGSDADGDIYYRDAGILKRLAKGFDYDTLKLVDGAPAWTRPTWTFSLQVGNDLNLTAIGQSGLARLNDTDVAFIDDTNNDLRTYRFDGTSWAQVGNDLNIAGVQAPALAALNDTDVAFIDATNEDLRVYRFDGTDWAQVGNDLNISGITDPALAMLNDTDVAFIDATNEDLRVYRFDGTDWAQVGNDLNISGITVPALAMLNETDVAFIDDTGDDLRVYRFDGTDWAQVGNDLNIATVGQPALAMLNETDVVFIDGANNDLRVYRFDGTDWAQEGNDLNISGIAAPSLAALTDTDVVFIDVTNADLRTYRWL
jgi:hypothetical protein